MNYDIPSRRNLRPIAPQDFTDAAANAIPHHRSAQRFLDADAEAAEAFRPGSYVPGDLARSCCLRAEEHCELRARAALTGAIYGFVFDAFQQTHGARKTLPRTFRIFKWA
jgi:hypothetical protein